MHRLKEIAAKNELFFPVSNVNDCVAESKCGGCAECASVLERDSEDDDIDLELDGDDDSEDDDDDGLADDGPPDCTKAQ